MRIKINLQPIKKLRVSLNYQHSTSSAIYKLIRESSPDFAEWLHSIGYKYNQSKTYKMFAFSKIFTERPDKAKLSDGILEAPGNASFFFASPVRETIIYNFIQGALKAKEFVISTPVATSTFIISSIEIQREPELTKQMSYRMLSPTCVSVFDPVTGKPKFLMPGEGVEERIADNLKRKYKALHETEYEGEIKVTLSENWKRKAIKIKEGKEGEMQIFAFESPLEITASPEMQDLAMNAGIGERNSMGFGMLEGEKR